MNLQSIRKQTVLKAVRDNGKWTGYIAPCNVNSYHITGGWHLGMHLEIQWDKPSNTYYVFFSHEHKSCFQTRKLEDVLNEFLYYNCNSELGKRIRYWSEQ
jgi:hypothetical protein